ncbi:MAG TPA: CIA30 family protein [Fibrobacteraceae bacterium]|nr:CIA30 family protein [Fibrobacteraceae bacterium]
MNFNPKKKILGVVLAAATVLSASTVNYPFPQDVTYGNGIRVASPSTTALNSAFETWLSTYYEEGTAGGTAMARVKWDETQYTVSEGIGYGMLIMVYFSDTTTSYQSQFDKLWAYYQYWSNSNGLMNWKINGFSSVTGENAATDAEMDVALALIMAYYQFGDSDYLTDAQTLIAKMRNYELDNSYILKPGDVWDDYKNPSYFAPAAMKLFQSVDASGTSVWKAAIDSNYRLLRSNAHSTTGLVSDWCDTDGDPVIGNGTLGQSDIYYYDAARTPWRLATSYAWFGDTAAKTRIDAMASWLTSTIPAPANITGGYYRSSGTKMNEDKNSTFIGTFAAATMGSSSYQSYLNSAWSALMSMSGEKYFSATLQLLTGLLISGNMPNLADMDSSSSSSSTATSSASTSVGDTIDDLEDGDYQSLWGGEWFTYDDNDDGGASVVTPSTSTTDKFTPTASPTNGTNYAAKITFTLDSTADLSFQPLVGLGVNMRADESTHDLTSCTTIMYDYLGSAHRFRVESASVEDYNYHGIAEAAASDWTTVSLSWSDLFQQNWGTTSPTVDIDTAEVKAFSWQIQGTDGTTGYLWIDNVRCVGGIAPSSNAASSGTSSSSSSSNKSSSSNNSSSSTNSSSSVEEGTSSSSTTVVANSSASLIDDVEDCDGTSLWGGSWYTYNDASNGGASTIDPLSSATNPFTGTSNPGNNSECASKISLTLDQGDLTYNPFVGMGVFMQASEKGYDVSSCSTIEYDYKGLAHTFRAEMSNITDYDYYSYSLDETSSWTTVSLSWSQLAQQGWGDTVDQDLSVVTAFSWQIQDADGTTGDLWIDNVKCIGATGPISSTTTSSSSASSSSNASSSSSSEDSGILSSQETPNVQMLVVGHTLVLNLSSTANAQVSVSDLRGRTTTLFQGVMSNGTNRLSLTKLESGIYFLKVRSSLGGKTMRIVIQ